VAAFDNLREQKFDRLKYHFETRADDLCVGQIGIGSRMNDVLKIRLQKYPSDRFDSVGALGT
jgi:hypothetical protein